MTAPPSMGLARVLVAEDDGPIRALLELVLARAGVLVDSVTNGREAIDRLRSGHYCVLILDLMMPIASGYEVIEEIRKMDRRPEVVLVSTAGRVTVSELDEQVVTAVVQKPFDVFELGDLIRTTLAVSLETGKCPSPSNGIIDLPQRPPLKGLS